MKEYIICDNINEFVLSKFSIAFLFIYFTCVYINYTIFTKSPNCLHESESKLKALYTY